MKMQKIKIRRTKLHVSYNGDTPSVSTTTSIHLAYGIKKTNATGSANDLRAAINLLKANGPEFYQPFKKLTRVHMGTWFDNAPSTIDTALFKASKQIDLADQVLTDVNLRLLKESGLNVDTDACTAQTIFSYNEDNIKTRWTAKDYTYLNDVLDNKVPDLLSEELAKLGYSKKQQAQAMKLCRHKIAAVHVGWGEDTKNHRDFLDIVNSDIDDDLKLQDLIEAGLTDSIPEEDEEYTSKDSVKSGGRLTYKKLKKELDNKFKHPTIHVHVKFYNFWAVLLGRERLSEVLTKAWGKGTVFVKFKADNHKNEDISYDTVAWSRYIQHDVFKEDKKDKHRWLKRIDRTVPIFMVPEGIGDKLDNNIQVVEIQTEVRDSIIGKGEDKEHLDSLLIYILQDVLGKDAVSNHFRVKNNSSQHGSNLYYFDTVRGINGKEASTKLLEKVNESLDAGSIDRYHITNKQRYQKIRKEYTPSGGNLFDHLQTTDTDALANIDIYTFIATGGRDNLPRVDIGGVTETSWS